ncbi:Protein-glutamate methylesterase/protein-glutamine glutaminase [Paenibacillus allorhizoplanae]|uniref:Protein-glutamate methylesterase/protein-glutamine glutaminase n=1 Tax=Paenibacillus allorhizoplanae TaxID=2905648 RepID=A0ABN8GZJ4_9BACL|nr:response regulator [Paenibacillus allorhizoplanae]CAH1221967.1 Protein-glutamate methylesterase/protein-glutamine glutaminase [Paenibacillus allorhizoplanae]
MLKILMVDDEKWVRERFAQRIPWSDGGFTFMGAASSAKEAISMIEREVPHLLLTDITMPNMNGLELAAYVRKRWPRVRIVILTAYGEFEYARQAIELGVDNYLIKLAQTPEQILEACRKVAEELEQELDIDQKLEMQLKLEREKEWARKRQWTERLMDGDGSMQELPVPSEWLTGVESAGYVAGITVGWRVMGNVDISANVNEKIAAGQAGPSMEELVQLQSQLAEMLEAKLDAQMLGDGNGLAILPLQHSHLLLLIGSKREIPAFHLSQLARMVQDAVSSFAPVKSLVHIGSVEELGKLRLTEKQLSDLIRKGRDGLAAYFYSEGVKPPIVLRRLDAQQTREWTAAVVKALQRENVEAFREAVSVMITLGVPPIHPGDLLRLTRQMLQPELVRLPDAVVARLSGIDRLTTWNTYCEWWLATIDAICEWWNQQAQPPVTVRKEIQWMCRYIREHYQADLQLAELAKLVHMHPSYAGQMFKQEIGENFLEYVNRVRMEKASEMLERTTMKIYEVSGAVGISDYRYFCKLFKSHTGVTPTQYKSKMG